MNESFNRMEHVAKALITLVKEANSGTIWMVANGEKAKEIPFSSVKL